MVMMPDNKRLPFASCFVVTITLTQKTIFHIVSYSKKEMYYQSRDFESPAPAGGGMRRTSREVALL